jgi:hypothetical protein
MCTVGTADFTSPMMYRKFGKESGSGVRYGKVARTAEDEAFACAVLYFKILFLTYSPYSVSDTNGIAMCIKNGDFRFKTDGKAQTRHNYRWLNLSRGIRQMFKNVFRENPVFYSDSEWINAFEEMWDEIGDHKLSNLITPDDAITDGDGLWHDETCRICHKTYEAAHKIEFDRLCPDCKCKRAINRKRIRRAVCSCCGSEFTVNEWDAAGMDFNSIMCPDCDRRMRVPKQNQAENESDFIAKQMNRALKNLFEL